MDSFPRFLKITAYGFLILVLTLPAATAIDLDSLFFVSVGGQPAYERLSRMTSYHARGKVNINGLNGRFEEFFMPPNRFYLEADFTHFSLVQAFDGFTAWQKDHNGFVSEMAGYEKNSFLSDLYFSAYAYLFPERLEGAFEYLGKTVKNGVNCHQVAFYPLGEDTVMVFFDVLTGTRRFVSGKLDNLVAFTTVDDYRRIAEVLIPFHSRAETQGRFLFTEFTLEEVKFDEPFDPKIFAMSEKATADFKFPADKTRVLIDFEYRNGHIYIKATINGKKTAWFLLDSGASGNTFNSSILKDLTLPEVGFLPARGMGGFDEVKLVRSDSIVIGELTLFNQVAGALNLAGIGQPGRDSLGFGGVLGYDLLSRFPIMINYKTSTITVFNPDSFSPPDNGVVVPFHLSMQVPSIEANLNGIPGRFIVDLGNPFTLILHSKFVKTNELDKKLTDIQEITRDYGGIGGSVAGRTAVAETFVFAGIQLHSLTVVLPEESIGLSGSEEIAGNIGNMLLEKFILLFDYARSRIIFYEPES